MNNKINEKRAKLEQELNLLKQLYDPKSINKWQPTERQREKYLARLRTILPKVDSLRSRERSKLHTKEFLTSGDEPEAYDNYLRQLNRDLKGAVKILRKGDNSAGPVKRTFEIGLGYLLAEQAEDPNRPLYWEDTPCLPGDALEMYDSGLVDFEPDDWLFRISELDVIRTRPGFASFANDIEERLTELYRSYVLGNWISVMAIARSILEFAIHDRASALGLVVSYLGADGKRRNKSLEELINDTKAKLLVASNDPSLVVGMTGDMHRIRKHYGNFYLHAGQLRQSSNVTDIRKIRFANRDKEALKVIDLLVKVLEDFYAANT